MNLQPGCLDGNDASRQNEVVGKIILAGSVREVIGRGSDWRRTIRTCCRLSMRNGCEEANTSVHCSIDPARRIAVFQLRDGAAARLAIAGGCAI